MYFLDGHAIPTQFFIDHQFAISWPTLYLMNGLMTRYRRDQTENEAWEERLKDTRNQVLELDPTMTALELKRQEVENSWSVYGNQKYEAKQQQLLQKQQQQQQRQQRQQSRSKKVSVMNNNDEEEEGDDHTIQYQRPDRSTSSSSSKGKYTYGEREYHLSDDEIDELQDVYGVQYDPYYDDPYTLEELPDAPNDFWGKPKYHHTNFHGTRFYFETGETFYCNKKNMLWYRSGSRPHSRGGPSGKEEEDNGWIFGTDDYIHRTHLRP